MGKKDLVTFKNVLLPTHCGTQAAQGEEETRDLCITLKGNQTPPQLPLVAQTILRKILEKLIYLDEYEVVDNNLTDGNVGNRK